MSIQERIFEQWKTDDIRFDLKISEKRQCLLLDDWLTVKINSNPKELDLIQHLVSKGENYIEDWNEQELQTKFITPITEFVNFDSLKYYFSAFAEPVRVLTLLFSESLNNRFYTKLFRIKSNNSILSILVLEIASPVHTFTSPL